MPAHAHVHIGTRTRRRYRPIIRNNILFHYCQNIRNGMTTEKLQNSRRPCCRFSSITRNSTTARYEKNRRTIEYCRFTFLIVIPCGCCYSVSRIFRESSDSLTSSTTHQFGGHIIIDPGHFIITLYVYQKHPLNTDLMKSNVLLLKAITLFK